MYSNGLSTSVFLSIVRPISNVNSGGLVAPRSHLFRELDPSRILMDAARTSVAARMRFLERYDSIRIRKLAS